MTSISHRVEIASKVMGEFKELERLNDALFWKRGECIWKLKHDNLWKFVYGDSGGTWASFCFDELGIPVSSADQKAETYEFFIKKQGLTIEEMAPYDTHSLYYIARYRKEDSVKQVRKWLADMGTMRRADFLEELRGIQCGHKHTHAEAEKKILCDDCGRTVLKQKLNGKGVKAKGKAR